MKMCFTFGGCKDGYLEQNANSYLKCSYLSAHSFLDYLNAQQGTKPWMNSDNQQKRSCHQHYQVREESTERSTHFLQTASIAYRKADQTEPQFCHLDIYMTFRRKEEVNFLLKVWKMLSQLKVIVTKSRIYVF